MTQPWRKRHGVLGPDFRIDRDLTVVDHLGGSRKVDIYLCRSQQLKGLVACKVLRPDYCVDFSALEAVMHEGQILCRLRHPNVVEGYGVELESHPRVVMQYLPGQTLSNTFFQGNYDAFDIDDVMSVVDQLADALSYIHQQGLVHLDVKPSNVMYHNGHVTLFDFSVAEEFSPEHPFRNNAGTVQYMAPEQIHRREIGYATDVFGLGVLFYQLLTSGELPYPVVKRPLPGDEDNLVRQLDYHSHPKPPSEINPSVPPSIDSVVIKAIQPDLHARYQTPSEFRYALRASFWPREPLNAG